MLTFKLWSDNATGLWVHPVDYLYCLFMSIFTVPLDIVLSPLEIIALIIWKVNKK